MPKIILFNGPPRSGKDTAALLCFKHFRDAGEYTIFERMSRPTKRAFAGTMSRSIDGFDNVEIYEENKEVIITTFAASYRQWQIDFEKFMKPLYGEKIFANLLIHRLNRAPDPCIVFISDCGFDIEYTTLASHYGPENILVVKLYRPGCTYDGDSRKYLSIGSSFIADGEDATGQRVAYINNAGSLEDFETKILKTLKEWLYRDVGNPK